VFATAQDVVAGVAVQGVHVDTPIRYSDTLPPHRNRARRLVIAWFLVG